MNIGKPRGQLYRSMQAMSLIPLLIVGIVTTAFSYQSVARAIYGEVNTELENIANSVILAYDLLYPGDYHLEGDIAYDFMKGEQSLTSDYHIIDRIKSDTQMEITIFFMNTRILTTIRDEAGNRIIGSGAPDRILEDVLSTGKAHFYTNSVIGNEQYFSYYTPLRNSDGSIIGMVYAGKPCSEVNASVWRAVSPIILIALLSIVVVSVIVASYTRRLTGTLQKIRIFLSKVAAGNFWDELDDSVLKRQDVLSEIGRSAIHMQRSLRTLVEQDTLTELNNRRFADKRLKQTLSQANSYGTHFVIAIGDIDLFKSINDTYGHECGDVALKKVAGVLKRHMFGKGFVARWGGEEFLFVFDAMDLDIAKADVETLLDEIRNLVIEYEDNTVPVTMTFGLAQGDGNSSIKELLQAADAKLYEGKENGRNRVMA